MATDYEKRQTLKWLTVGLVFTAAVGTLGACSLLAPEDAAEPEGDYQGAINDLFAAEATRLNNNSLPEQAIGNPLGSAQFGFDFVQQQYYGGWVLSVASIKSVYFFPEESIGGNKGSGYFEFPWSKYENGPTSCETALLAEELAPFYCSQNEGQKGKIGRPLAVANIYSGPHSAYQRFDRGAMFALPSTHAVNSSIFVLAPGAWYRTQLPPSLKA